MTRRCAFLSMESLEGFFSYDELLVDPFRALGWEIDFVPWRRPADWSRYEAVVIRTPWDYPRDPVRFVEVLREIDRHTRLENPLDVVLWNLDKRYLFDLEQRGVPIVPSLLLTDASDRDLFDRCRALGSSEVILKPLVSANAENTHRLRLERTADRELIGGVRGKAWLVQPFLPSILDEGEASLFFFGGEFSHAITKRPAPGDFRVQEEHGGRLETIRAGRDLLTAGALVLRSLGCTLLYARVDLVRHEDRWLLMELELIEPSLYFNMDPESPHRFARIFDARMSERKVARPGSGGAAIPL